MQANIVAIATLKDENIDLTTTDILTISDILTKNDPKNQVKAYTQAISEKYTAKGFLAANIDINDLHKVKQAIKNAADAAIDHKNLIIVIYDNKDYDTPITNAKNVIRKVINPTNKNHPNRKVPLNSTPYTTETNGAITIKTPAGELRAYPTGIYSKMPGINLMLNPVGCKPDDEIDIASIHVNCLDNVPAPLQRFVNIYVYDNPNTEDYTISTYINADEAAKTLNHD